MGVDGLLLDCRLLDNLSGLADLSSDLLVRSLDYVVAWYGRPLFAPGWISFLSDQEPSAQFHCALSRQSKMAAAHL